MNNIINLDNILGKTLYMHTGTYNVLYSRESSLRSALALSTEALPAMSTAAEPTALDLQATLSELEKEWVKVDPTTLTASSSSTSYWQPLRMLSDWWFRPMSIQQSVAESADVKSYTDTSISSEKVTQKTFLQKTL